MAERPVKTDLRKLRSKESQERMKDLRIAALEDQIGMLSNLVVAIQGATLSNEEEEGGTV